MWPDKWSPAFASSALVRNTIVSSPVDKNSTFYLTSLLRLRVRMKLLHRIIISTKRNPTMYYCSLFANTVQLIHHKVKAVV